MVVLRRLETGTAVVLKAIDELIDRRRAEGLRAFGVMLSDEPGKVAPHLQTISFDEKLSLPLSVGPETLGERDTLSVDSAASLTIVVYRQRKVAWTAALGVLFRLDQSQYFPSADRLSDLSATVAQNRRLNNMGLRSDLSYSRGIHTARCGGSYWQTRLRETFISNPA